MRNLRRIRTRWLALAAGVAVAAAVGLVALPALADTTTGTVTASIDDSGVPQTAWVLLYDTSGNWFDQQSATDGSVTFTAVPPGTYSVQFSVNGYTQWASQKLSPDSANVFTVVGGDTVDIHDSVVAHGSLTGRVTNADGTPAAFATVAAQRFVERDRYISGMSDVNGVYTLPIVPGGSYLVSFQPQNGSTAQYANNTYDQNAGAAIAVTNGTATTLDQTFLATGAVTGTVTDHGHPVGQAYVTVQSADNGPGYGSTYSGADGSYRIPVPAGSYVVQYTTAGGLSQYAHRTLDYEKAARIAVAAGADTVVDEPLLPNGSVTGHLTDATGSPLAQTPVYLEGAKQNYYAVTDDTGAYHFGAYVGTYRLSIGAASGLQWAHQKTSAAQADPIVVTDSHSTVVDDALAASGSVDLTMVDSVTHAPVQSFCAALNGVTDTVCTSGGTAHFPVVQPGTYAAWFYSPTDPAGFLTGQATGIVVTSGSTSAATLVSTRGASVTTTMRDARTGAPVADACLDFVPITAPNRLQTGEQHCSDATGTATAPLLEAGSYKVFVHNRDGHHGDQWVGPNGGVGAFNRALTVTVAPGDMVTMPPVTLALAGSITGTITDAASGQPLPYTSVCLSSYNDGFGPGGDCQTTDAAGHYTMTGLGPYQWTLFLHEYFHAAVFSGGTPDRNKAIGVKVRVNQTSHFDAALGTGTTITGKVFGPNGERVQFARITFVNANSADEMGSGDIQRHPYHYSAHLAGPQRVKIQYDGTVNGVAYRGYLGGSDFASATAYSIPTTDSKNINVTMTQVAG